MRSEVQYFEENVGNANLGRREGLRFLEVFSGSGTLFGADF